MNELEDPKDIALAFLISIIVSGISFGAIWLFTWLDYLFNQGIIDFLFPWNFRWWHFFTFRHWWTWLYINEFFTFMIIIGIISGIIALITFILLYHGVLDALIDELTD